MRALFDGQGLGDAARLRVRAELVDVISTAADADRASYEVVDLEARASSEPVLRDAA